MRSRGLSMLEMVVAMGLLFLTSSFVMGMFLTGSRMPERSEENLAISQVADSAMQEVLDQLKPPLGGTVDTSPISGRSGDFTWQALLEPADFDPDMLTVTLTVGGPAGRTRRLVSVIPSKEPVPPGEKLVSETFNCMGCHTVASGNPNGGGDPSYAPQWTKDSLQASADASGKSVEDYIADSVRQPNSYVVSGYGYTDPATGQTYSPMGQYGSTSMTDEQLRQITDYLKNLP